MNRAEAKLLEIALQVGGLAAAKIFKPEAYYSNITQFLRDVEPWGTTFEPPRPEDDANGAVVAVGPMSNGKWLKLRMGTDSWNRNYVHRNWYPGNPADCSYQDDCSCDYEEREDDCDYCEYGSDWCREHREYC